jgi:hypothetical protein
MRRESSAPPATAIVLAVPTTRLIALPTDKASLDEGLSSSQYLENQSGSGRKGPRHAGGNIGRSSGRELNLWLPLNIYPSLCFARQSARMSSLLKLRLRLTDRCEAVHTGSSFCRKAQPFTLERRCPELIDLVLRLDIPPPPPFRDIDPENKNFRRDWFRCAIEILRRRRRIKMSDAQRLDATRAAPKGP